MPERPDLRHIARDIRESLGDYDREALLEILTYVFKEYVVEGVPPALLGRADTIEDLAELSFPELIRTLQTRLEHPELELFQVESDVVLIRAGGALSPLTEDQIPQRSRRPAPVAPTAQPSEVPSASAQPRASANEAAARGRGDLAGGQRAAVQAPPGRPAPPPRRGLSINGRSSGGASGAPPAGGPATPGASSEELRRRAVPQQQAAAQRQQAPAQGQQQPQGNARPPQEGQAQAAQGGASKGKDDDAGPEGKHPEGDDAASIRFSLLELD